MHVSIQKRLALPCGVIVSKLVSCDQLRLNREFDSYLVAPVLLALCHIAATLRKSPYRIVLKQCVVVIIRCNQKYLPPPATNLYSKAYFVNIAYCVCACVINTSKRFVTQLIDVIFIIPTPEFGRWILWESLLLLVRVYQQLTDYTWIFLFYMHFSLLQVCFFFSECVHIYACLHRML